MVHSSISSQIRLIILDFGSVFARHPNLSYLCLFSVPKSPYPLAINHVRHPLPPLHQTPNAQQHSLQPFGSCEGDHSARRHELSRVGRVGDKDPHPPSSPSSIDMGLCWRILLEVRAYSWCVELWGLRSILPHIFRDREQDRSVSKSSERQRFGPRPKTYADR